MATSSVTWPRAARTPWLVNATRPEAMPAARSPISPLISGSPDRVVGTNTDDTLRERRRPHDALASGADGGGAMQWAEVGQVRHHSAVASNTEKLSIPRPRRKSRNTAKFLGVSKTVTAAGSPRKVTLPRLPRIRTCPARASGSSGQSFAARRRLECTATAGGRGTCASSWANQSQFLFARHDRVPSHFRQILLTSCRNLPKAPQFPVMP